LTQQIVRHTTSKLTMDIMYLKRKDVCNTCRKVVTQRQQAVQCDICERWVRLNIIMFRLSELLIYVRGMTSPHRVLSRRHCRIFSSPSRRRQRSTDL